MQLVRGIGAVYPNVVSVYVSYKVRCREEVMVTVARHLVDQGIMSPAAFTHALHTDELIETVQESLIGRQLRLLLVVDDVDDLYRVDHAQTPAEGYAAFRTLGSLAALGSWSGGMTAKLLCGSFALPQLLFCGAMHDPGLRQQYPAVVGAPDLNDTKYSLFLLRGGLPTDLCTARIVCGSTTDEEARSALFHAGGSVRGLEGNTAVSAVSDSDFHRVIMAQLRLENEDVLQSIMDGVRVNHDRVASVPWETQLRPLSWTAVKRLWRAGAGSTFMADVVRLTNDGHIMWDASDASNWYFAQESTSYGEKVARTKNPYHTPKIRKRIKPQKPIYTTAVCLHK
jgi:hypothetical protein